MGNRWMLMMCGLLAGCATSDFDQMRETNYALAEMLHHQAEQLQLQQMHIAQLSRQHVELQQALNGYAQNSEPRVAEDSSEEVAQASEATVAPPAVATVEFDDTGKLILGQLEWVWFDLFRQNVKSRVDTGAASSSLYVSEFQLFERDGKDWVRFNVPLAGNTAGSDEAARLFEAPLAKTKKVRSGDDGELERRPVVRLKIKLGQLVDDAEFVLVPRDNATYPVLLGRTFLRDIAVVDVARKYTQSKNTITLP